MKYTYITLVIVAACYLPLCCRSGRVDPARPDKAEGWREHREQGVHVLGSFILKIGEATDNTKIQVKLLSILPHDPCASDGSLFTAPRARMQFVRVADKQVLCEENFSEGSNTVLGGSFCGGGVTSLGVGAINIRSINEKEEWTHFDLIGFW